MSSQTLYQVVSALTLSSLLLVGGPIDALATIDSPSVPARSGVPSQVATATPLENTAMPSAQPPSAPGSDKLAPAGKNEASTASVANPETDVLLHGTVSQVDDVATGQAAVEQLFSITPKTDSAASAGQQSQHFHINHHMLASKGRNILNYMFDYRAFGPSTEAANVILNEHGKAKSVEAKAYDQQQQSDTKHLQTVENIMQLAMGIGMPGTARGQKILDTSLTSLRDLVGEKQTDEILATLQKYGKTVTLPKSFANQELLDIQEREKLVEKIVESAIAGDQTLQIVSKDLHRYNRHSKLVINGVGLVQAALGVAAFSPTFAAPAAETAYFVLMLATGGPEQDKLLRELYLSKCLEDRRKVVREKAHLAIDTYQIAVVSENPVLLGCAQAMVRQMSGASTAHEVFGGLELVPPADGASAATHTGGSAAAERTGEAPSGKTL